MTPEAAEPTAVPIFWVVGAEAEATACSPRGALATSRAMVKDQARPKPAPSTRVQMGISHSPP